MELLKNFFDDNSTVIGLCDLKRRTETNPYSYVMVSSYAESENFPGKRIINAALCNKRPNPNFFMGIR